MTDTPEQPNLPTEATEADTYKLELVPELYVEFERDSWPKTQLPASAVYLSRRPPRAWLPVVSGELSRDPAVLLPYGRDGQIKTRYACPITRHILQPIPFHYDEGHPTLLGYAVEGDNKTNTVMPTKQEAIDDFMKRTTLTHEEREAMQQMAVDLAPGAAIDVASYFMKMPQPTLDLIDAAILKVIQRKKYLNIPGDPDLCEISTQYALMVIHTNTERELDITSNENVRLHGSLRLALESLKTVNTALKDSIAGELTAYREGFARGWATHKVTPDAEFGLQLEAALAAFGASKVSGK